MADRSNVLDFAQFSMLISNRKASHARIGTIKRRLVQFQCKFFFYFIHSIPELRLFQPKKKLTIGKIMKIIYLFINLRIFLMHVLKCIMYKTAFLGLRKLKCFVIDLARFRVLSEHCVYIYFVSILF